MSVPSKSKAAEYSRRYRERHPGRKRASAHAYYESHKEQYREKKRAYRRTHLAEEAEYQKRYRHEHPGASAALQRRSYMRHREERVILARRKRAELKEKVLTHYGGRCQCCGETAREFLTIDHINGGGTKHRRSVATSGDTFYRWIVRTGFPADLRVLCFNCNCSLGMFGYCPHTVGAE